MKKVYLIPAAVLLAFALSGCTSTKTPTNTSTTTTSGKTNTTATATVDGTGLIVTGNDKQNGDSLSPIVAYEVPVGVTSTQTVATLKAENFQINNLQAGGTCTTPTAADLTKDSAGMSPGLDFSFHCTTTGTYIEKNILDTTGKYDPINNFKYAGLQPKDINRTFSFDLVVVYPDGTSKRKTLTGSFDAAKVIEGIMQNGATLTGKGETF